VLKTVLEPDAKEPVAEETVVKDAAAKESFIQAPVATKSAVEVAAFETALAEAQVAKGVPARASVSTDSMPPPETSLPKLARDQEASHAVDPTKPKPWRPRKIIPENDKKGPTKGD